MKKQLLPILMILMAFSSAYGQRKVSAMADLMSKAQDTVLIKKGKSFVVQLPVHNRKGDDWVLAKPAQNCEFTEASLAQAGTLPNQLEPKLFFFKAKEKGSETISFRYKTPSPTDSVAEKKLVIIIE